MTVKINIISDLVCSQRETPLTGGLDTYSTPPLCYACFFGEQQPGDERLQNLRKEDAAKLGEVIPCFRCNGTGERKEKKCFRCHGRKQLTAVICDTCNGTGKVEHECDCELCYADHEDCQDCKHGVAYVPFRGKPQQVNNPEKLREYWTS